MAATEYAESIDEDDLAIEIGGLYQALAQAAPADHWDGADDHVESQRQSLAERAQEALHADQDDLDSLDEDPNPVDPFDVIFTQRPSFSSAGAPSGKSAEEYTEEQLLEAEHALEEALRAADDPKLRGQLLGAYRDIIGMQFRYYDDVGEEAQSDNFDRDDKPEVCPVCGNDYVHMGNAPMGAFTLNKSDAPTCFKVAEDGLRHIHHSEENGPDMSLP
ncbi:hypothetical protein GCM10027355_36040 [Haloplanus salinarum]|uniref:hypothetical protein n=1 Tax=Haloplanus salinarum TaxID=1912324 RepID=UPI003B434CF1